MCTTAPRLLRFSLQQGLLCCLSLVLVATPALGVSKWKVSDLNSVTLDDGGLSINELSGVSLLENLPTENKYRFIAALEDAGELAVFDVQFATDGTIVSAVADRLETINSTLDYEGIVSVGNDRVFLSEESTPGIREFDLSTGNEVQTVSVPAVFGSARSNRGFESLTQSQDGGTMWTANEEALAGDGPVSSTTAPTTVRLQQFGVAGSSVTAGAQYAYDVEPVHAGGFSLQRGVSELVVLDDGSLLALERSFALGANPTFVNEIYEVDFSAATDVSQMEFNSGLSGQSFTPVEKNLVWPGSSDTGLNENLEGLTFLDLENGPTILLGVTDNQGALANTIVALEVSRNQSGDFDEDGDTDGTDFLTWQQNFGTGSTFNEGDATFDGAVDGDDLTVWEGDYSGTVSLPVIAAHTIPEPTAAAILLLSIGLSTLGRRR